MCVICVYSDQWHHGSLYLSPFDLMQRFYSVCVGFNVWSQCVCLLCVLLFIVCVVVLFVNACVCLMGVS